ncbi:hypothetical protein [Streptomyces mirabilis]|uniref:hypothetical protein n=1 Tax=Streptomyces mirabilis TaxID=68239 RepID=UPI0036DC7DF6
MVVADLGQHPGAELDSEPGEAQDHVSVRVLRKRLLDRLGEVVSGGAGGFQLDEEGEQLLAEGVLDQRRLVRVLGAEDLADPVGFGINATLSASPFEGRADLRPAVPFGPGRGRGGL